MLIKTRRSKGAGTALQKMLEFFCIFQISQKEKSYSECGKTKCNIRTPNPSVHCSQKNEKLKNSLIVKSIKFSYLMHVRMRIKLKTIDTRKLFCLIYTNTSIVVVYSHYNAQIIH